jgi:hypothetical protein
VLDATQACSRLRDHSSKVGPQELHAILVVSRIHNTDYPPRRSIHALPRLRFIASTSPVGIVTQFGHDRSTSCNRGSTNAMEGTVLRVPCQPARHGRFHARGGAPQSLVLVFGGPLLGDADRLQ